MEETYRLWTFQSVDAIKELRREEILQAGWHRYSPTDYSTRSYRWMVKQMAARDISCSGCEPIWAWHSCNTYGRAPGLGDARALLSDLDLQEGIQTIEFECPAELVLLSTYGTWNSMLEDVFCTGKEDNIDQQTTSRLFSAERKNFRKYDSIQAALPYLRLDWVKEIRVLNLKPNDFAYNTDEEV